MTKKRLWVNEAPEDLTTDDFVWRRSADGPSSLQANVDAGLAQFGPVASANRDAVWLAVAVFLADRTVPRGKAWQRDLQVVAPAMDPVRWRAVKGDVDAMLSFLTSDKWDTTFALATLESEGADQQPADDSDLVCLFSGGADSVCGAVHALSQGHHVTLMSHWDWSGHSATQSRLIGDLEKQFEVQIPHVRVNLGRGAKQIGGAQYGDEPSRRSRSLLFVTLGLAVASARGSVPLWIAENGFASLNPPLASERRGALSTRTTHPEFLGRLRALLQAVGAHADFANPFGQATKGEMFSLVAQRIGHDEASALLSKSHSCSHVRWGIPFHRPPDTQCGVCFGCLVRRAAFIAAGLEDRTTYLVTDLNEQQRMEFLSTASVRAGIEAMRYAVSRELGPADILALNMPNGHDLEAALDLIRRGFRELAAVELP
ncbi:MAG: hypothetical protein AB7I38_17970 [Dehalococcoidia bacterium]